MNIWFWLFLGVPAALQFAVLPSVSIGWRRVRTLAALVLATLFASLGLQELPNEIPNKVGLVPGLDQAFYEIWQSSVGTIGISVYGAILYLGGLSRLWRRCVKPSIEQVSKERLWTTIAYGAEVCLILPYLGAFLVWFLFILKKFIDAPYLDFPNIWIWVFLVAMPVLQFSTDPYRSKFARRVRTIALLSVGLVAMTWAITVMLGYDERLQYETASVVYWELVFVLLFSVPITLSCAGLMETLWRGYYTHLRGMGVSKVEDDKLADAIILASVSSIVLILLPIFFVVSSLPIIVLKEFAF